MNREEAIEALGLIDDDGVGLTDWEANYIDKLMKKSDNPLWKPSINEGFKIQEILDQRVNHK